MWPSIWTASLSQGEIYWFHCCMLSAADTACHSWVVFSLLTLVYGCLNPWHTHTHAHTYTNHMEHLFLVKWLLSYKNTNSTVSHSAYSVHFFPPQLQVLSIFLACSLLPSWVSPFILWHTNHVHALLLCPPIRGDVMTAKRARLRSQTHSPALHNKLDFNRRGSLK